MATYRRRLLRTSAGYDEDRLDLPGWSVGWNDEISAHAAVRSTRGKLFVMTSLEHDGAPQSLDDEVAVGIYRLDDDEWEMINQATFDSVSEVLAMSMSELERAVGDGGVLRESPRTNPWNRFRDLNLDAAVVIQVTRDGFLATVRKLDQGVPGDIFYDSKTAATGTGSTVEIALRKALDRMPR